MEEIELSPFWTKALFSLVGLSILALAFLVLLVTFGWVARLLGFRPGDAGQSGEEREERPVEKPLVRGRGYGASYGLLLGILSCGFFWVSPLVLAVSLVGMFYSGRALWQGIRYLRRLVYRALVGLALSVGSVGLHYWKAIGGIPAGLF